MIIFTVLLMALDEIIIEKIKTEGPISFRDFMEMALYYPGLGYYTSAGEKIGRKGDYLTSPVITSLFGSLIARQLHEMLELLDEREFTIVEFGPGNGKLCHDILQALSSGAFLDKCIRYYLVERSNLVVDQQKKTLPDNVEVIESIAVLDAFSGCVLSNEVPDNFPVHRVMMQDELMEVFVDFNGRFVETLQPASSCVRAYLKELNITLPNGFQTEINLDMLSWLEDISHALQKGFLMTIDYGDVSENLYRSALSSGTLLCYHHHCRSSNPYENIGQQDITAHINFSALAHWGKKYGLSCSGLTTQSQFLLSLGLIDQLRSLENDGKQVDPARQCFMIRDFLMNMGTKIKVMIQHKGIANPFLGGMQFSQPVKNS